MSVRFDVIERDQHGDTVILATDVGADEVIRWQQHYTPAWRSQVIAVEHTA